MRFNVAKAFIFEWNSNAVAEAVQAAMEAKMAEVVLFVKASVIESLSQGQPASRPGKPPHILTGELRGTITGGVQTAKGKVYGRVGSTHPAAARLELGFLSTDARGHKVHQLPRPFLRPAIYKNRQQIRAILGRPDIKLSVKAGRRVRTTGRIRQARARIK